MKIACNNKVILTKTKKILEKHMFKRLEFFKNMSRIFIHFEFMQFRSHGSISLVLNTADIYGTKTSPDKLRRTDDYGTSLLAPRRAAPACRPP